MFKLTKFFKPIDWLLVAVLIMLIGTQVYFDLFLPDKIQDIMQLFTMDPVSHNYIKPTHAKIWETTLYAVLFALGSFGAMMALSYTSALLSNNYSSYIRKNLFSHINSLSADQISKLTVPSLITRNTSDSMKAANGFNATLRIGISAPATAIGGIIKVIFTKENGNENYSSTLPFGIIIGVGTVTLVLMFTFVAILLIPRFKKSVTYTDTLNQTARENISGIRVVRAFNAQEMHTEKYIATTKKIYKNDLFIYTCLNSSFPMIMTVINFITIGIYWAGAHLIYTGAETLAFLPVLIKYTMLSTVIVFAFVRMVMLLFYVPPAMVSSKRIMEVFNVNSSIVPGKQKILPEFETLEFKNVSLKFSAGAEYALKDINFKITKGETLAIVGSTGSGKSTVINLIPRIYDATEGEILLNGVNIKEYDTASLHDMIGFVPQKNFLFGTTVKENIRLGIINEHLNSKEANKRIKWAAKIAQADSFVTKLEGGYEHVISQNATNLSGGQKQRLAIARALVRKPEILIFDDSFSALDMATDQKVRESIKDELNSTKIIVAQRIGTILNADKIVVLDNGKIVGIGNHKELMKKSKVYKEIALSQLSRKELSHVK